MILSENRKSTFSDHATQSKTAREGPAPLGNVKRGEARSALTHERRRWVDRLDIEVPAHAERQVMRGNVFHGPRELRRGGAGEVRIGAGRGVTETDVAIAEFERHVRRDLVGETGVHRPGKIPFAVVCCISNARRPRYAKGAAGAVVAETGNPVIGRADAGTDERGHAPPGAEIDIGVSHENGLRLGGAVVVDQRRAGEGVGELRAMEVGFAAPLSGDISPEPVVELITDADIK